LVLRLSVSERAFKREGDRAKGATHSNADKLLMEQDPGEEVDEGCRAGEEGHHNGRVNIGQRVDDPEDGCDPEHRKEGTAAEELQCGEAVVHELAYTLPALGLN